MSNKYYLDLVNQGLDPFHFVSRIEPKLRVRQPGGDDGLTKQSHKKECDINFILQQFQKTGTIAHQKTYQGSYGEFADIDFHEAMNQVARANEMFETVPAHIRAEFGNDPAAFLNFVQDDKNEAKLIEMGLARARPEPSKAEASVAVPEADQAAAADQETAQEGG